MHFLNIENVCVGDIVAVPVKDYENRMLIGAGKVISKKMLGHLEDLGVTGVYVTDNLVEDFIPDQTISHELKSMTIRNLKKLNMDFALGNARDIVNSLCDNPQCDYLNSKTFDDYTYEHSISVAIYATLVGIADGMNREQLYKLAYAGLLHDIGKMSISKDILNKPDKLTFDEYEEVKRHPEYGYNLFKDNYDIGATTKMGIYEHHENEDGSGYPRGLTGDKIYKFAKIVHVVDVYDALVSKRPYKEPLTPAESLEYLKKNKGILFDSKYVDIFVNIVPAYPKGIMVNLSNGEIGIVLQNHIGNVLRPKIKLIDGEEIDLATDIRYKNFSII